MLAHNKGWPWVTASLVALACLVMLLPPSIHQWLYFDRAFLGWGLESGLESGQWWGLISGHWVHVDTGHLLWNAAALALLAAIIERRSKTLLLLSLAIGTLFVDALLMSPLSSIQRYCGLSGMLNTLFGTVLLIYWRETRSSIVPFIALLSMGKVLYELFTGDAIFTNTSWPPYALAHVAGLLGAGFIALLYQLSIAKALFAEPYHFDRGQ